MLSELIEAVEAITGTSADRLAAPDTGRAAVVSTYAAHSLYGNDANLLDIPAVQIDVFTTDPDDDLPEQVMALLQRWHCAYSVEDLRGYEQETNRLRTILQLELI